MRQLPNHKARFSCIATMLLGVALVMLVVPGRAEAQTTFDVSATFADINSTPLTGTLTINTATGAVDGFDFNIPTMTIGSTTLDGALFTPLTANKSYVTHTGGSGSEIDFQLFDAPADGEELFLEIPQTSLVAYAGGSLLQELTSDGTMLHTGYQSGAQSNPFIEITEDGSIKPTPEPGTAVLWLTGMGLMIVMRKRIAQLLRLDAGKHRSLSLPAHH